MAGFIDNPTESTQEPLELMSEFSKVTLSTKSIYKNQSHVYIPAVDD